VTTPNPHPSVLLKNALMLVTMDDSRREIAGGWVLVRGRTIEALGGPETLPPHADDIIDMTGHVVMPGMVNTHHHMYQTLTRALAQDASLFDWLKTLYPIWARITPDMIRVSTQTAMAELVLSGCTTSSDHLYLYPNGSRLDDQIDAARMIGMRFHAARGSMSVGESAGGLPPDHLVENEAAILKDTHRVIQRFHDPAPLAMTRVVVAPCSPFSVSQGLMKDAAALARETGTMLHTHLAENDSDVSYSQERFGKTPAEYAEDLGWVGPDVWHAHCVKLDAAGISTFGRTRTGVAHCPCSNMRLGSGIAPLRTLRAQSVRVGLGVDGSASNDCNHMLGEARQAMLLARVMHSAETGVLIGVREILEIATRGGAETLGRSDIGYLAPGMAADIVAFNMNDLEHAGALHDPVAALLLCAPGKVSYAMINGRFVVRAGDFLPLDLGALKEMHNRMSHTVIAG